MNELAAQFGGFCTVGVAATVLQYVILIVLVKLVRVTPVAASTIGFLVAAVVNYVLNYKFTFRSTAGHRFAMVRFCLAAGAGLLLNGAAMFLLTQSTAVPYLASQVVATAVVLLWNFTLSKYWTFKSNCI